MEEGTTGRTLAGWALGLGALGVAGFAVRPAAEAPVVGRDLDTVPLADDLPPLLRRHLDPDGDGRVPRMETSALWGRPRLRIASSPWLPARMRSLRAGAEFVNDIDVTWFGRSVLHVVDAYVEGHGITRVDGRSTVGREVDQGANLFLWSEAVLIPAEFAKGTRIHSVQEDSWTIRLEVPSGEATDTAWLDFSGGFPRRFSALRYKRAGLPKVWWHVDYVDWHVVGDIRLPRRIEVTWADERRPWMRFTVDNFAANLDVEWRLADVRALVGQARAVARRSDTR